MITGQMPTKAGNLEIRNPCVTFRGQKRGKQLTKMKHRRPMTIVWPKLLASSGLKYCTNEANDN